VRSRRLSRARVRRVLASAALALALPAWGVERADIEAAARAALPQAVAQVRELVRLPSITTDDDAHRTDKTATLRAILAQAQALGLQARLLPGEQVAVVELPGPEPALGILTHADVVPPGDLARWRYPPFSATLAEGAIWGRGAQDDKGPTVAVLHAMAIVRGLGVPLARKVRLIVGTSEENMDWRDLDAVTAAGLVPPEGFAADAGFPVIHAEKSFLDARVRVAGGPDPVLESLAGGVVPNAVPESATATLRMADPAAGRAVLERAIAQADVASGVRFEVGEQGGVLVVRAHGKAAHGSRPADGINAAAHLAVLLYGAMQPLGIHADSATGRALRFLGERLALELDGATLGLALTHPVMGATTLNLGVVDTGTDGVSLALNVRAPVGLTIAQQRTRLGQALAPYGGTLVSTNGLEALWVEPDAPLVQRLLGVYRRMSTDTRGPLAIGGTTYAKAFPGFVAFGMGLPGAPLTAHAPDERLPVDHLEQGIAIYAATLLELAAGVPVEGATMPAAPGQ
jgi:succinyl-diaminopimelate desuccinylase